MLSRGFSLIEVLIAVGVLSVAALGVFQLVASAIHALHVARVQNTSATLAAARLEQLRGLQFEYDPSGLRLTDTTTSLATDPPGNAGSGIAAASPGSLDTNTPGFVDFLDASGGWVGSGATPPPAAVFLRRWSVERLGTSSDAVVLQVLVSPVNRDDGSAAYAAGETRLITVLARTAR